MAALLRRIRMALPCPTSPFSCIHFSPLSSTPSTPNPQTPVPSVFLFLLTECDFSPSQISKVMQTRKSLLKTKSADTAREAVEFLKQRGFTQPQLHNTILRYPGVLVCKVDSQLKPNFHFFRTLGFIDQDLRNLVSLYPTVLGLNLESKIIPRILFLENLFGTRADLIKALKRTPALLTQSIDKQLKPKLDFFKQWGIEGKLLSLLLSIDSRVLVRYNIEYLRARMEYARNTMGVVEGSKFFVFTIRAFLCNGPQTVEKKIKHLQCLGFLEDEVRELFKRQPMLLTCSTNKIQENMDFLTQTAGLKPNVVLSYPYLLQFSVKKRLIPRHAIFKALSSQQQPVPSLQTILSLSQRSFLGKIVECSPQASMLKEIYKSEMDSPDIGSS